MSDEPPPLRLKPRPPSAEGAPPPPPASPPAPAPDPAEATSRLRLKPRMNLPGDAPAPSAPDPGASVPFIPPPPSHPAGPAVSEAGDAAESEPDDAPKFKLRPKAAGASRPPPPPVPESPALLPPPLPAALPPLPPLRGAGEPMPEAPPLEHSVPSMPPMPPMSILAAPLPPAPGAFAEAPAPPGSIPRLSLANPQDKPPPPKGALGRLAEKLPKIGGKPVVGKPVVAKPGKTAPVLRRRAALSPVAKAGLTFVILAIGVGGFYSFRIFFPEQPPDVRIRLPGLVKPITPADLKKSAADALAKAVAAPGQLIDKGQSAIAAQREQEQAKLDALAGQEEPTPTAAPTGPSQTVMGNTSISSDVKVGNTPIDAGPAASAAFRAFVASANVGGVYQGIPAKALINGSIVREGQVVDGALGVAFERIDAVKKVIYFKDYTGAVVSKNY